MIELNSSYGTTMNTIVDNLRRRHSDVVTLNVKYLEIRDDVKLEAEREYDLDNHVLVVNSLHHTGGGYREYHMTVNNGTLIIKDKPPTGNNIYTGIIGSNLTIIYTSDDIQKYYTLQNTYNGKRFDEQQLDVKNTFPINTLGYVGVVTEGVGASSSSNTLIVYNDDGIISPQKYNFGYRDSAFSRRYIYYDKYKNNPYGSVKLPLRVKSYDHTGIIIYDSYNGFVNPAEYTPGHYIYPGEIVTNRNTGFVFERMHDYPEQYQSSAIEFVVIKNLILVSQGFYTNHDSLPIMYNPVNNLLN